MVPAPRFPSWEAFNEQLEAQCLNNRKRRLRRHTETIEERFKRDRQALLPLPPTPYDACDKRTTRVTSLSLVRYRANDYSVPTRYGHRQVLLKGYVDEIVICCGSEEIARHRRSYEREELIFDPLHYLALLERKTNALDQAAPLAGWELPEQFTCLRRCSRHGWESQASASTCRYCDYWRNSDSSTLPRRCAQACELGAIGLDAVRHLVLCRIEQRPPRLDLTKYPHLPAAQVEQTSAADYLALLHKEGVMARSKLLLEAHLKALRLPPSCASTTTGAAMPAPRAWIRGASCNNSASWNCSTVNSGPPSAASRPRSFP